MGKGRGRYFVASGSDSSVSRIGAMGPRVRGQARRGGGDSLVKPDPSRGRLGAVAVVWPASVEKEG